MFEINDKVVYGVVGVCEIENIGKPPIKGIDKDYYFLQPVYDSKGIIYSPVDSTKVMIRGIIDKDACKKLIDVGAKFEIYQLIAELAKKGKGIIIISSEMPELLGITDRILVMSNGLVSGIVDTKTTTQNEILRLASLHL